MGELLETLTKIPLYAGLLLFVGAAVATGLVPAGARASVPIDGRIGRLGRLAIGTIVVFLLLRLMAHTAAVFPGEVVGVDLIRRVGIESRWGHGWRLQGVTASVLAALLVGVGRRSVPLAEQTTLILGAALLAATYPLVGHAAGSIARQSIATTHILAGGAWVGTLGILVLADPRGDRWGRFSNVALVGASVVVLSGLLLASSYLTSWRDLFETGYGRLLSLKVVLLFGMLTCGAMNFRRVRDDQPPPLARVELSLALMLVVVTAFLTETAHP